MLPLILSTNFQPFPVEMILQWYSAISAIALDMLTRHPASSFMISGAVHDADFSCCHDVGTDLEGGGWHC